MSNEDACTVRCPKCKRILLNLTGLIYARGIIKCLICDVEVIVDMSRDIHADKAKVTDNL